MMKMIIFMYINGTLMGSTFKGFSKNNLKMYPMKRLQKSFPNLKRDIPNSIGKLLKSRI